MIETLQDDTYHNVTTSFEYVFVGIDFALAKPENIHRK